MILNEDFFDSDIDVAVKDDTVTIDYEHSLMFTLNKDKNIKVVYLKKCLSNVQNFDFSEDIEIINDPAGDIITVKFNSSMTSVEEVKMLFKMLNVGTLREIHGIYFDKEHALYDYMVKRLLNVILYPKDMQYDKFDCDIVTVLREICDLLCNKSGEYPDFFYQLEIAEGFEFPKEPALFRNNFIDIKLKMMKGFHNPQKYDIQCPKGQTSRVVISYKKLFECIENIDYQKYKLQCVYLHHNMLKDTMCFNETVSSKKSFRQIISTFKNYEDMIKKKKYLLDERAIFTAIKIDKNQYNDCSLLFPIYDFYDRVTGSMCYYYIILKWKIDNFPHHLEIA